MFREGAVVRAHVLLQDRMVGAWVFCKSVFCISYLHSNILKHL